MVIGLVTSVYVSPLTTSAYITTCSRSKSAASKRRRTAEFVERSRERLLADAARGGGEFLSMLAELLEVPAERREDYYRALQAHVDELIVQDDHGLLAVTSRYASEAQGWEEVPP